MEFDTKKLLIGGIVLAVVVVLLSMAFGTPGDIPSIPGFSS